MTSTSVGREVDTGQVGLELEGRCVTTLDGRQQSEGVQLDLPYGLNRLYAACEYLSQVSYYPETTPIVSWKSVISMEIHLLAFLQDPVKDDMPV